MACDRWCKKNGECKRVAGLFTKPNTSKRANTFEPISETATPAKAEVETGKAASAKVTGYCYWSC